MKANQDVNCMTRKQIKKKNREKKMITVSVTVTVTITSADEPRDSRRRTFSRPLIPLDKVKEEEDDEETVFSFSLFIVTIIDNR